jgi:hypothetical protein
MKLVYQNSSKIARIAVSALGHARNLIGLSQKLKNSLLDESGVKMKPLEFTDNSFLLKLTIKRSWIKAKMEGL